MTCAEVITRITRGCASISRPQGDLPTYPYSRRSVRVVWSHRYRTSRAVNEDLRSFLIGKGALAGETLWDEMYRSNRHSRDGISILAISAIDNALWDLRGRVYKVPVYRLLGGPTRNSIEAYASCLGFSLEPEAVRTRCLQP